MTSKKGWVPSIVRTETFNGQPVQMHYSNTDYPPGECPDHKLVEMGNYGLCTGFVFCTWCMAIGHYDGSCTGEHW